MRREIILGVAGVALFGAIAYLMIVLMPQPLKRSDYLIAGSVAVLVSMFVVFLAAAATSGTVKDLFFKRRPRR